MRGSSTGQPRRLSLQAALVFAASHAPRFFLSFPRGVPLLASLEQSRPRRTLQSIRLCFASGSAPGVHLHPSQVCSHTPAANAFPHHLAHVPFTRIQLAPDRFHRAEFRDDSVLVGQRDSSPEMDSASGLRSRLWSALGQAPGHRPSPASSIPALGFVLFQVCRRTIAHRRGLDTATITGP